MKGIVPVRSRLCNSRPSRLARSKSIRYARIPPSSLLYIILEGVMSRCWMPISQRARLPEGYGGRETTYEWIERSTHIYRFGMPHSTYRSHLNLECPPPTPQTRQSCSFGVQLRSSANVRSGVSGRLSCSIMQDMVDDVWAMAGILLYSIQYLCFWNPAHLQTTEFDHQWDVLELAACACCSEYRCTASEDAIWIMG